MFGHPSRFYVQTSIVTDVVTIDILDLSAMMHCCILAEVNNNRIIIIQ